MCVCVLHRKCESTPFILCVFVRASLCVSGCKLGIPGRRGCNLTGGLTLVNPLLGVQRMMMWAVDPPRWFHFLRASSRSQIEKLWGYYKVRGWLTLNMMTIPRWHFHFLKRLIPHGSWDQRCLLIFCSNKFFSGFKRVYMANMQCSLAVCLSIHIYYASKENFLSFCPSNIFRGAAVQPTSGSSWCF